MRCRICRHAEREAIEIAASSGPVPKVAGAFGLSETALARHLEQHGRAGDVDEELPPTTRSPSLPTSGVIVAPVPDLTRARAALVEALAHLDAVASRGEHAA